MRRQHDECCAGSIPASSVISVRVAKLVETHEV